MNIKRFIAALLLVVGSLFVAMAPAGACGDGKGGPGCPTTTTTEAPCRPAQAASDQCGTYPAPNPTTTTTVPCEEDQPCWNCNTMGNHVCGTTTTVPAPTTTTIVPAKTPLPVTGGSHLVPLAVIGLGAVFIGAAFVGAEKKRKKRNYDPANPPRSSADPEKAWPGDDNA